MPGIPAAGPFLFEGTTVIPSNCYLCESPAIVSGIFIVQKDLVPFLPGNTLLFGICQAHITPDLQERISDKVLESLSAGAVN